MSTKDWLFWQLIWISNQSSIPIYAGCNFFTYNDRRHMPIYFIERPEMKNQKNCIYCYWNQYKPLSRITRPTGLLEPGSTLGPPPLSFWARLRVTLAAAKPSCGPEGLFLLFAWAGGACAIGTPPIFLAPGPRWASNLEPNGIAAWASCPLANGVGGIALLLWTRDARLVRLDWTHGTLLPMEDVWRTWLLPFGPTRLLKR